MRFVHHDPRVTGTSLGDVVDGVDTTIPQSFRSLSLMAWSANQVVSGGDILINTLIFSSFLFILVLVLYLQLVFK